MSRSLYDEDFVRWTEEQARAIRDAASARVNLPIDWENVAEEIDSLGRSNRRELASRIATIIEHLVKLEASPAVAPRRSWEETVQTQRREIVRLVADSPSLRGEAATLVENELRSVQEVMRKNFARWGEQPRIDLQSVQFTEEQVLGDWFPGESAPISRRRRQPGKRPGGPESQ